MTNTCFVIMAIGDQNHKGQKIKSSDLKSKYDTFIKKAITDARPTLEVTRADEVNDQGNITNDIITRLLFSDFVIADITYPNPNVYYELGIRHCCKLGTILIKEKDKGSTAPFDVSHERYIEYINTAPGLANLTNGLKDKFQWYDENSSQPDNHILVHAKNSKFNFPQYGKENEIIKKQEEGMNEIINALIKSDSLFDYLIEIIPDHIGQDMGMAKGLLEVAKKDKEMLLQLISGLYKMGVITPEKMINLFMGNTA